MVLTAAVLAALRGVHLVMLASLFGTLVSLALVAPAALAEAGSAGAAARADLVRLARGSAFGAVATCLAWMVLQAAVIAGADSFGGTLAALWLVARDTQFGHFVLLRLVLLALALPLLRSRGWRQWAALGLSGAALALQGEMGHAGAAGGSTGATLLVSEALHLLAAGAWLGGLLPLYLLAGSLPPAAAAIACESFSPVGLGTVLAIACTAIVQAVDMIGSLAGLFGTTYGHIALLKLGLFLLLLALAALNRFVLVGRLRDRTEAVSRRGLRLSLLAESAIGVAVIVVAAFLASGTPATHETPLWPFARQPSLELLYDPFGRVLLLQAAAPTLIAAAVLAVSWFWRRLFWPAAAALLVCLAFRIPDLVPLLSTEAYPTTFVASPTEFAASSIMRGATLFAANCTLCHGADARGDGPAASTLPVPPADLTAAHFWGHRDGDLFWFISHGIAAPSGAPAMPAFGRQLSSGDRWALIDFLKANNAGAAMRRSGSWDHPVPLPQLDAICADGTAIDLDDLRGRMVRVVAVGPDAPPPPLVRHLGVTTILLARDRTMKPPAGTCIAAERASWDAFALLLGVPRGSLAGTQALADANGWLRLRWRPGDTGDWNAPTSFAAVLRDVRTHPLAVTAGGGHAHHH